MRREAVYFGVGFIAVNQRKPEEDTHIEQRGVFRFKGSAEKVCSVFKVGFVVHFDSSFSQLRVVLLVEVEPAEYHEAGFRELVDFFQCGL